MTRIEPHWPRAGARGSGRRSAIVDEGSPSTIRNGEKAAPAFAENAALDVRTRFRSAMRLIASTVALVTASHEERRGGMTATAACSLSLDPPLVLVCINRRSHTHPLVRDAGAFCVNYLAEHHRELADVFAHPFSDTESKFALGKWGKSPHGSPALLDSLASIECRLRHQHDEGTHSVFIGSVVHATANPELAPLIYAQKAYGRLVHDV
jgi:flavin reductase (DIM6/NTAB) family NADH-FMN oxidoreductase RutF